MTGEQLSLSDEQIEQLADLVAARVVGMRPAGRPMLTAQDVSKTYRVSRAWVYENAGRLGGFRLGPGDRGPLRFDPETIAAALTPKGEAATPVSDSRPRRRASAKRLLPVYDG